MKLRATIADNQTDIRIRAEGSRVFAAIDDRQYEIDVHESGVGGYLFVSKGRVFDCRIEGRPESARAIDVVVGTERYAVTLIDPKRLRGTTGTGAHAGEAARIIAQMPGKVVRVLVDVGTNVKAGAGIIVVEAMKMQNEMKSPKAGVVAALNVQVGATVNAGDVLATIE